MTNRQPPSKALHVTLWVVQLLLASSLFWAAYMKLFQPIDQLAVMWPWAGLVPAALVKFTGVIDFLGGAGLVLPGITGIKPRLTVYAAAGVILLMLIASAFHISRGEGALIAPNVVFALLAAFVAWGRCQG